VEVKKKDLVEVSNNYAVLESLDKSLDNTNAWKCIRENFKTSTKGNQGYHRLMHNKPCFEDEC
jgi:hypothetical protein